MIGDYDGGTRANTGAPRPACCFGTMLNCGCSIANGCIFRNTLYRPLRPPKKRQTHHAHLIPSHISRTRKPR